MPTFILTINWTDQGIRAVKDAPKRSEAARELAQKVGVEIRQVDLTSGEHDILVIAEAPSGPCHQIRACDRFAGKRAHPHLPSLARARMDQADIRASIAASDF